MENLPKKENFFKKALKKITKTVGMGAIISSPHISNSQTVEPYQTKDSKDYKYRKQMYQDSLHAFNESELSKKIYETKDYDEALKLAGSPPYPSEKLDELVGKRTEFDIKANTEKDPILKKKYEEISAVYQKAINSLMDPFDAGEEKMESRFNAQPTNLGSLQRKSHNKSLYTKNKNNEPKIHFNKESIINNEAYEYKLPLYQKPIQEVLPPKQEIDASAKEIPIIKEEPKAVLEPEIHFQIETFLMPDGKKYTYKELIENYPSLKDPEVFERTFHKKPPIE